MKRSFKLGTALMAMALMCVCSYASADLVKGYEFDSSLEGFVGQNTSLSVVGGSAVGTTTSADGQLRIGPQWGAGPALGLDPDAGETWDSVVFRVREDDGGAVVTPFASLGLAVVFNAPTGSSTFSSGFTAVADGDFFVVNLDISSFGSTTIDSIRLDPIGGPDSNGNSFQLDYIRLNDTAVAVPEPSSLALLALVGVGAMVRRKR